MKRIIILFAFLCSYLGHAQIVNAPILYAVEDAQTSSGNPSVNYWNNGTMGVSKTASSVLRSFLKFNLDTIPSNAVITSAILKLTPSFTENVSTSSNTNDLYLDVCNTSWTETGLTHSSNISNNTLFPTVTTSNWNSGSSKREFQLKDFVQAIVEGRLPNNGWRIRRNNETTNVTTNYLTREDATQSNRPQLVIQYYLRSYVSAAAIVHTSSLSSTDGSISPTVTYGSNTTMTYRWFNSSGTQISTSQNLTGIGKGWYGLKYYGGADGDTTYQAFIVGTECEDVSITFDPGPNYIDDARIHDLIQGSGTTVINFNHANQGTSYPYNAAQRWTWTNWYNDKNLLRFRIWVDPGCQVNTADMTMTGNSHSPLQRTNESELNLNTSQWAESGVAYSNAPTYTATGKINIAAIPAGNNNLTKDIASFFNTWKTNNPANYGMLFQLQSYAGNLYTRMQFNSSDATTPGLRPQIVFSIKVNTCDLSRKGSVVVTNNDNALKKTVQVNITPPSWAVSPYNYVISNQVIPEPNKVLKYLNDSVFDPDVDSVKFYMGNVGTTTFSFGDVDYNHYNIAVFDNNGKRIFEKNSIDMYPAITLLASTNAAVVDNNMIRPSSAGNALCVVNAFVNTYSQGSVKINPKVLTGTQYYGFVDAGTALTSSANIRYGYYLTGNKLYTIKNYVVSGSYINVGIDNYAHMNFVNDTIIFTNDTMVLDKVALTAGYSFKFGGVMNSASRTYVKIKKTPIQAFFFQPISSQERTCASQAATFQFKIVGFLTSQFGSYNYQLVANNTNTPTSFSGSGSNNGTVSVSNVPPGVYTLTCTQSSGGSPITVIYTIYVGIQAEWYSTHPNYNLTPNTYSLSRNNVNAVSTYSSAISSNILAAGTKGWIWFNPVVSAFLQNRNDYMSIVDNFVNTQPTGTQTYLTFRKILPTITGGGGIIPGGIQVVWNNSITGSVSSTIVPANSFITIELTGALMNVKANGVFIASITQPVGGIRLKANSNRTNEGFKDVHTTFACTPGQTIDEVFHYELARDYTAGYATAVQGKLKFTFDEEYGMQTNKFLQYTVYRDDNSFVASSDLSGTTIGGASAIPYNFDDNRYTLTVSSMGLTLGKFYHLEVTTTTGQKRVLRFLYKN
jgi:hypothetical protein